MATTFVVNGNLKLSGGYVLPDGAGVDEYFALSLAAVKSKYTQAGDSAGAHKVTKTTMGIVQVTGASVSLDLTAVVNNASLLDTDTQSLASARVYMVLFAADLNNTTNITLIPGASTGYNIFAASSISSTGVVLPPGGWFIADYGNTHELVGASDKLITVGQVDSGATSLLAYHIIAGE